jgi:hypothetical protein
MQGKLLWDYFNYWSMNSFRFIQGKLCDLQFTGQIGPGVQKVLGLSGVVGQLFQDWDAMDRREWRDAFIEGRKFPGSGTGIASLLPTSAVTRASGPGSRRTSD